MPAITVPLIQVWDQQVAGGSSTVTSAPAVANRKVTATLNYAGATFQNPVTSLSTERVSTTTDTTGYWTLYLAANNKINPSGTTWSIQIEGMPAYDINVTDVAVPGAGWQSSAIVVNTPQGVGVTGPTLPAGTTAAGAFTVVGAFIAQTTAAITGALTAASGAFTGALTAASATLTGALTAATGVFSGVITAAGNVLIKGPIPFVMLDAYAVGDGVADDTTAINNALANLPVNGGAIICGTGKTYKFTAGITLGPKHIRITGAGRDPDNSSTPPTIFSYQPAGTGTTAITVTAHDTVLEGFILLQGNATANTKGIVYSGVFQCSTRDVTVRNFTAAGITMQALSAASCIWNVFTNVFSSNNTVGLDLIGFPSTSRVINNNAFVACQFTGNALGSPNVRLTGGTSENTFYACDVTGGNGQTLVQVGDGVNTCRGNKFDGCTAEGGGGGGIGFDLRANSSMTWIGAEITSSTLVNNPSNVTALLWDHVTNIWRTYGNIGLQFDSSGNIGGGGSAPAATGVGYPTGWSLFASGNVAATMANASPALTANNGLRATNGIGIDSNPQGASSLNGVTGWNVMASGTTVQTVTSTGMVDNKTARTTVQTTTVAAAGTVTPDASLGDIFQITYSGSFTMAGPTNAIAGQRMSFKFVHDGTASAYTITWNGVWKRAGGAFANTNTAAAVDTITFELDTNAGNWYEIGRAINLA